MEKQSVITALKKLRETAKKRNFEQSLDLIIDMKGVDFKKNENKISAEIVLPKGRGKNRKVAIFAGKALSAELKGASFVDKVIPEEDITNISKKEMKKLANEYAFFLSEPTLMPLIGKTLGGVLGPRHKMPKPVPPNAKAIEGFVNRVKNTVMVSNKARGQNCVKVGVGTEKMSDEDLAENIAAVVNKVVSLLPQGEDNIRKVLVKFTMSPAVVVGGDAQ